MVAILELLLIVFRIGLLVSGVILTFFVGEHMYLSLNRFLQSWYLPCLEIITSLVAFVPAAAIFYGIHIRKYFWQREKHYNNVIFLVSYAVGALLALVPESALLTMQTGQSCGTAPDLIGKFAYATTTGLITAVLAYIGMDIGVSLKHTSLNVGFSNSSKKTVSSKKKSIKKRK